MQKKRGKMTALRQKDDGRTPEEYALKMTEKIVAPVVSAALIVIGAGAVQEVPTIPAPIPVPVP